VLAERLGPIRAPEASATQNAATSPIQPTSHSMWEKDQRQRAA
jgi:hypothetical protein